MLIVDKDRKYPAFHEPRGKAEFLIASGAFVAVESTKPKVIPNTHWSPDSILSREGVPYPPCLKIWCSTCGIRADWTGKTVSRSQVFRHCGVTEKCPDAIAKRYEEMWKTYFKQGQPERKRTAWAGSTLLTNHTVPGDGK